LRDNVTIMERNANFNDFMVKLGKTSIL